MTTKVLQYQIGMDIGELRRKAQEAATYTNQFKRELDALEQKQRAHRKSLEDMGRGMATFGASVAVGLGVAAKAAIDWESAFAGVRKTVDGSDAEIAALEGELRALARVLPSTHQEIAGVAEAAGQLGIKRQDIAAFTKTMIDLGNTTNLTSEEAATGLAKVSNIMGTSAKDVDRLGSALVALGNDGASTEKDILDMALRIAGAGKQIGLTEAEVLGLASALSSVGITAEGGGSSISTTMVKMSSAVSAGGKSLQAFATVAGMSSDQFAKKFKEDAGGAVTAFIAGLGRMQQTGGNVFATLEALGLNTNEVRDTLLRAAGSSDLFSKSLQVGSKAWQENNALTEEANKRYDTAASKIAVAWNQIQDALIDAGAAILPVVAGATEWVTNLVVAFRALPDPVKDVISWVGTAVAGLGVLGGTALLVVPKILAFRESMTAMVAAGGAVSGVLGRVGLALTGPWGAAIAIGTAALGFFGAAQADANKDVSRFTYEIDRQTNSLSKASIEGLHKYLSETKVAGENSAYLRDILKTMGLSIDDVIGYLMGEAGAQERVNQALRDHPGASEGHHALKQFLEQEKGRLEEQKKAQEDAAAAADKHSGAQGNLAGEAQKGSEAQKQLAQQTGMTAEEAKEAAEGLTQMIDKMHKMNDGTLNARSAEREFVSAVQELGYHLIEQSNAVDASGKVLGDRARTLDQNTEAGRENAAMLDDIASKAMAVAEAAAREAEEHNGAAAGAEALTRSLEASRPALFAAAQALGMSADEAARYVAEVLGIPEVPPTVIRTEGTGQAVTDLTQYGGAVEDTTGKQGNFTDGLKETTDAARHAKQRLDQLIQLMRDMSGIYLDARDAQRNFLGAIHDATEGLKEQMEAEDANGKKVGEAARTLDIHTEAGRRNSEALDNVAQAALDAAEAAAREAAATGGAEAGAKALAASLASSRTQLISVATGFGMSQTAAEAYANQVLRMPTGYALTMTTPGSVQVLNELMRVRQAVINIPPDKEINVGVLSSAAIQALNDLGYRTRTLPDKTVVVSASTAGAWSALNGLVNAWNNRTLYWQVQISSPSQPGRQGYGGQYTWYAQGGIHSFASGGYEDHSPQIYNSMPGVVRVFAEPETGRESYIPWAMDRRKRATTILGETARAFGYMLVPRSQRVMRFADGGMTGRSSGWTGGPYVIEVTGGGDRLTNLLVEVLKESIRKRGGDPGVLGR